MKRASSKAMKRIVSLGASYCLLFTSLMVLVSFHSDDVKALSPTWGDAMEMGPGEWKNYSNGAGTEWQLGTPENVGPNSTHSGVSAWGTNIAANYSTEALAYLESPTFDLILSTNTELIFWHYLETEDNVTNNGDGGIIEVSTDTGITWVQVDDPIMPNPNPYYDTELDNTMNNPLGGKEAYCYDRPGWEEVSVDLSQFNGSSSFMFRFAFGSDTTGGSPGWYIDDVLISADVRDGIIVEPDYSRIDLAGTTHRFNLTVRNLQKISDVIDIVLKDAYGWPMELFMWDGVSPLADTGGAPGIPDTGTLFKGASRDIVLEVTIPPGTPYGVNSLIQVKGVPYSGPVAIDMAYVHLSTPTPDVSIIDFSVPGVHISGEEANVTASIRNNGRYDRSFEVSLKISGPGELQYDPVRSVENLSADEMTNVYWTFIPTITGDYAIEVMTLLDIDVVPWNNVSTKQMTVMTKLFEDTMENGGPASQGKWTAGSQPKTAWELGVPVNVGPNSCHSTTKCWGTNLNSAYRKAADIRLETPTIDLSGSDRARLRFSHFYQILGPWMNDGGFVEISSDGGSTWSYIEPLGGYSGSVDLGAPTPPGPGAGAYAGSSSDWKVAEFDLNPYSGEQIIIGFHLWTDPSNYQSGWAGWYIDDVQILHVPKGPVLIF
ncbi:MAG: choice-of-anchor J domain-containing protein, partial [Thermoplasmata archaeon]